MKFYFKNIVIKYDFGMIKININVYVTKKGMLKVFSLVIVAPVLK